MTRKCFFNLIPQIQEIYRAYYSALQQALDRSALSSYGFCTVNSSKTIFLNYSFNVRIIEPIQAPYSPTKTILQKIATHRVLCFANISAKTKIHDRQKKNPKKRVTLSLQSRSMSTHYLPSMHGLDIFTGEQTMLWARCVAQCSLFRTKTMASGCVMVLYVLLNYIFTKSQGTDTVQCMYSSTFGHFGSGSSGAR